MSIQTNQYLIYGISVPKKWPSEWLKKNPGKDWGDTFEPFMGDSAYKKTVKHKDGIFCLYDGMGGDYIVIGKVLHKSQDGELIAEGGPISIDEPTREEKQEILVSIRKNFGLTGVLKHWLVTHYR